MHLPTEKFCPACKETLPISAFRIRADRGQPQSWCKPCTSKGSHEWRKRNPKKVRGYNLKYGLYDITLEQYEERLAAQGGVCKICQQPHHRTLPVDHDHVTGKVRGILCDPCNRGLGYFRDDPKFLQAAADYLENS